MKTTFAIVAVFVLSISGYAQKSPESYLANVPAIPANICTASFDEVNGFNDAVNSLKEEIRQDVDKRTEAMGSSFYRLTSPGLEIVDFTG